MTVVPFLDLKSQIRAVWPDLRGTVEHIVSEAQFILGSHVQRFEQDFAAFCGTQHCVGVNNGTSALHMALLSLDIGPGDEVITTPHSWISTSWAIAYTGATPVFVDIDRDSYNIDAALVEAAVSPRTKAVLPVHLYGHAADMTALREICDRHNLRLIEDAAQAHGAHHSGNTVGSLADAGCFSFYPGKNLGAFGEAGAVTTNSAEVAARIRRLRDHAQDGRHNHVEIGFNTRMEGLQGAVLSTKLKYLPHWTEQRRRHADFYCSHLRSIPGLTLPTVADPMSHVWHLFVILVRDREEFRAELQDRGVATGVHYPTPIPYQPAFEHLGYRMGQFPVTEHVMSRCVSLPMFPELSEKQRGYVVASVRDVLNG
jgi:dTDP-4-amino-4,6-dideoxygalactose transaminase